MASTGNRYRVAGRTLESSLPLPSLASAASPADLSFVQTDAPPHRGESLRRFTIEGKLWLEVEHASDALTFRFPGWAVFTWRSAEAIITGYAEPATEPHTFRHLLLDQVLPLCLASQGSLVLHASGVAARTPEGSKAILFVGKSGAGKSSLAIGCSLAGAELVADDFVVVDVNADSPAATPAGMGVRLFADVAGLVQQPGETTPVAQYTSKRHLVAAEGSEWAHGLAPLGAVALLAPRTNADTSPWVELLGPAVSMITVIEHSFRLDLSSVTSNGEVMASAGRLAESVPFFRLSVPDDVEALVRTSSRVLELLVPLMTDGHRATVAAP